MTYGFDQCIRCGKTIAIRRDVGEGDDFLPSNMSEAEWRAAGYLGRPNRLQAQRAHLGCCRNCAEKVLKKKWKVTTRVVICWGAIFVFLGLARWLLTIFIQ
jgi:hypothetical protein